LVYSIHNNQLFLQFGGLVEPFDTGIFFCPTFDEFYISKSLERVNIFREYYEKMEAKLFPYLFFFCSFIVFFNFIFEKLYKKIFISKPKRIYTYIFSI
jgi:hypothetical protein